MYRTLTVAIESSPRVSPLGRQPVCTTGLSTRRHRGSARCARRASAMVEFGHCTIAPPLQGAALALEDEQLGFDIRYFGDNHSLHPDPFVALFDAAHATTRIKLATG